MWGVFLFSHASGHTHPGCCIYITGFPEIQPHHCQGETQEKKSHTFQSKPSGGKLGVAGEAAELGTVGRHSSWQLCRRELCQLQQNHEVPGRHALAGDGPASCLEATPQGT